MLNKSILVIAFLTITTLFSPATYAFKNSVSQNLLVATGVEILKIILDNKKYFWQDDRVLTQ